MKKMLKKVKELNEGISQMSGNNPSVPIHHMGMVAGAFAANEFMSALFDKETLKKDSRLFVGMKFVRDNKEHTIEDLLTVCNSQFKICRIEIVTNYTIYQQFEVIASIKNIK